MTGHIFKKAVFISLLGHIAVFSVIGLSFGTRIARVDFSDAYFWGEVLRRPDFISRHISAPNQTRGALMRKQGALILEKINTQPPIFAGIYLKPHLNLPFKEEKEIFMGKPEQGLYILKRKESEIIFYPPLPYPVSLYFKDRQRVHIELMFNVSSGSNNSIIVKRKVSSGNLEADLLSMRYISRYLFIQQAGFNPNHWQTVKIDLSVNSRL